MNVARARNHVQMEIAPHYYFEWPDEDEGHSIERCLEARDKAGGTDERLSEDYFDLQLEMLQELKPPIVGHFDLIRMLSDNQNASLRRWDGVWKRLLRNLELIATYGGVIEVNSAALRKGMDEPFPQADICKVRQEDLNILKPIVIKSHC